MTEIAAYLTGYDNDRYMVASCEKRLYADVPEEVFCSSCGWKKKWDHTRPSFALGKKKQDVSCTYDHAMIVSSRFRDIALKLREDSGAFVSLPAEPGFFHLVPSRLVSFDLKRRGTRQAGFCPECDLFSQTAGATPVMLVDEFPSVGHIFRTDVFFGSYNARGPLIVVSGVLSAALEKASLTGFHIHPIQHNQPPEPTTSGRGCHLERRQK
ncbi:MAG TPA: hypothetical protein VHD32_06065 [Candidatus Didemnitutus sp.]|nr:hypothetical protein [Candidatus Didemnitutus sp.]